VAQRESALQQATKFHAKAALSGSGVYGDTIKGGPGVDLIFGGANSDTIDKLGGFTDIVFGNEGNDSIKSSASFAVLVGGEGNDNLVANSPGGSLLLGDTFTWLGTSLRPQISLDWSDTTLAQLTLAAGLLATGEGKDRLSATGKYNVLFGGGGNDTIKGGSTFNFMVGDSIKLLATTQFRAVRVSTWCLAAMVRTRSRAVRG